MFPPFSMGSGNVKSPALFAERTDLRGLTLIYGPIGNHLIAQTVARKWMGAECVEWNEKLAAEYTESALKIKGRLDELTAQINARRNPKGWIDKETERLLRRRATLYKMYGDTVHIAHILENYYVDK